MTSSAAQRPDSFRLARLLATTALCACVSWNAQAYDRHTPRPSKPSVELNLRALDVLRDQVRMENAQVAATAPAPFQPAPSVSAQTQTEHFPVIDTPVEAPVAEAPVKPETPAKWTPPVQLTQTPDESVVADPIVTQAEHAPAVLAEARSDSMPPQTAAVPQAGPERVKEEDTVVGAVSSWLNNDDGEIITPEPPQKTYVTAAPREDDTVVGIVSSWLGMNDDTPIPAAAESGEVASTEAAVTAEQAYASTPTAVAAPSNDLHSLPPEMGDQSATSNEYDLTAPPQEILLAQASQAPTTKPAATEAETAAPAAAPTETKAYEPHYFSAVDNPIDPQPTEPTESAPVALSAPAPDYEDPDSMSPDSALAHLAGITPEATSSSPTPMQTAADISVQQEAAIASTSTAPTTSQSLTTPPSAPPPPNARTALHLYTAGCCTICQQAFQHPLWCTFKAAQC